MKICLFLLIFASTFLKSSAYIINDQMKNLQYQIDELKERIDDVFQLLNSSNCETLSNSTTNQTLTENVTNSTVNLNQTTSHVAEQNNTSNSNGSLLQTLKGKIQNLVHTNKTKGHEAAIVRRCLTKTVRNDAENIDTNVASNEEIKQLLQRFFKCLKIHLKNDTVPSEQYLFDDVTRTTESPEQPEDHTDNTKQDAYLRYLASSKHPVEEVGRPKHCKPDLRRTQEIIDNAKSSIWINFEDDDEVKSTTTEEYENVPEMPILKRSANLGKFGKKKRNGLFKGIVTTINDFQYEAPAPPLSLETPEPCEDPLQEINKLVEKISLTQQEDLMKFLDQLNDKPKEFKFNVDKYFKQAYENLTRFSEDNKEENEQKNIGPRKFFEFESGRKRRRNSRDPFTERLRHKFENDFKDHHHKNRADFKKIVEHIHDTHIDNSFLDKTYKLNDGSIKTSELVKHMDIISHVKSPKEVNMDIELGEKIKEIEDEDYHPKSYQSKSEGEVDAPFYKTEIKDGTSDFGELLP